MRSIVAGVASRVLDVAAAACCVAAFCMAVLFAVGDSGLPFPLLHFWTEPTWDLTSAFFPLHWVAWKGLGMAGWIAAGMFVYVPLRLSAIYVRERLFDVEQSGDPHGAER